MIEFYKDRFDVCVYYERMNPELTCSRHLIINDDVKFDSRATCIVPLVTRLVDATSKANVPFEIIDITYSADQRMVPLRHLDDSRINYFVVNGKKVAQDLAVSLCENAGLKESEYGSDRKTYRMSSGYSTYSSIGNWTIEGKNYSEYLKPMQTSSEFTGHLVECRKYINEIEQNIRQCFDRWAINDRCPDSLTTGMVIDHLRKIESHLRLIQTKKKTQREFDLAMATLAAAKQEVTEIALEDIDVIEEEVNDGV